MIVVAIHFFLQDCTHLFQSGEILQRTSPHNPILQLALPGLRLSRLGVNVVGMANALALETISPLDEPKHLQGIHVIAQRDAIGLHDRPGGLDMALGGLLGAGRPLVRGGLVLEEGPDGDGHHLAVMGLTFPATL